MNPVQLFLDTPPALHYFWRVSSPNPFISFIIPVYNEEFNIRGVFRDLYALLDQHLEWNWEVVVIEDGSKDHTRSVIVELVKQYTETKLVLHEQNQGYVRSMRDGIRQARGQYLMYIGADEEFDCSEIPSFIEPLMAKDERHADVVLGVRWQRNAYKLHRFFLSVIYIFFLNYLFKLRVNDYNWSQVWSRELLERIHISSKSLFMLPEIIIKAHDLGYKIKEIPSNHRGRRTGRSSLNLKIMGHALLEGLSFFQKRSKRDYNPLEVRHSPAPTAEPVGTKA